MKKYWQYIIIAAVAFLVGVSLSYAFFHGVNNKNIENNKEVSDDSQLKKEDKVNHEISEEDVMNKIYPLMTSVGDNRIYQKEKVDSSDLSNEKVVLGAINYIVLNRDDLIIKKEDYYTISLDDVNKQIRVLFDRDIKIAPKSLASIYSQTELVYLDVQDYIFNLEFYDGEEPVVPVKQSYLDPDVLYDRVEVSGDQVFVYDKIILNNTIDWSDTGVGTISKFDGTNKIEVDGTLMTAKQYYNQYPDYFTEYKHTFKINGDGTYTYVSSEPIV